MNVPTQDMISYATGGLLTGNGDVTFRTRHLASHLVILVGSFAYILVHWQAYNHIADGLVEIHPVGTDEIFVADITFGNPPQLLKMAFDTGSADV
jgi:hypothetical protein